jgi:transposase-like protein
MSRMEIITRTERRRRWSIEERERILAECKAPGATVRSVAQHNNIAESMIYSWRSAKRSAVAEATEPLAFIPYGQIVSNNGSTPLSDLPPKNGAALPQSIQEREPMPVQPPPQPCAQDKHDLVPPHPGNRPGTIDILLGSGMALSVDAFVNEKALARVLKALGHCR